MLPVGEMKWVLLRRVGGLSLLLEGGAEGEDEDDDGGWDSTMVPGTMQMLCWRARDW